MQTIVLERSEVEMQEQIDDSAADAHVRGGGDEHYTSEGIRVVTVEQGGARDGRVRWRELPRRIFYATWRVLPGWAQGVAFRLGSPKVSLGAVAVIQDVRGRILLAHHTYRQRPWGLPGGLVGQREQAAEAVARELREELGVTGAVGPLLYAETCLPGHHLTLYYLATIDGQPCQDGIEIDGFRYVAPEEALALLGEEAAPWLASMQRMVYPRTKAS